MKLNKGLTLVLCLLVATIFVATTFAQETTGGLQGTVKDSQGAVISNAEVEVTSPSMIGVKKLETDAGGYYRFANLPPGVYTITASAKGFRSLKQTGLALEAGHLPTIDLTLQVGTTEQTVEVSSAAPLVDIATSKVQTNISSDQVDNLPKGRSFQSMIQFAPGARSEPLQGGYQIDGASNSENSYLVEGQETASAFDGHSSANVPTEFIQEVQVKSSGFEAEYGGALGGVVNVIQKRGSNAWHGSVFSYYEGSAMDANGAGVVGTNGQFLRRDPNSAVNGGHSTSRFLSDGVTPNPNYCGLFNTCRLDSATEVYQPTKDYYRIVSPGFEAGGFLKKDRLWVFGSLVPQFYSSARTVNFTQASGAAGPRDIWLNQSTYYGLTRIDYLATQKIRLYGAMNYNYDTARGTVRPQPDSAYGQFNQNASNPIDSYNHSIGYVAPNTIYNAGADITITPSIVATTRFGYFFDNYGDRGLPVGLQYIYRDTNYNYGTGVVPANLTTSTCSTPGCGNIALNGTTLNTVNGGAFVHPTGYYNIGANLATLHDAWKRWSLNQDIAWFKKGFGTHNLKGGFAWQKGNNDVFEAYNTADVYVAYNQAYVPNSSTGANNCAAINAQNVTWFGNSGLPSNTSADAQCMGNWGTLNLRDYATVGKVGGNNYAMYVQDAWTLKRLTLNLGVRFDDETLPPYETEPGFKGIHFGWGSKIAPRLGGAYDIFGNGKLKVYGSFGYFYDIMKYNLPRGSFGGDFWHDCVYAMDTPDYSSVVPARDSAGHYCPLGGQVGANGTIPATTDATHLGLRFIENYDYRQPSNDPNSAGSLGPTGLVDPSLKPMKQHEMVFGADYAIGKSLALETRYSRKRLDRTIEDTGVITSAGETYYISNPGFGSDAAIPSYECSTCPANPKAVRNYDGVEFRLTKQASANWYGSLSYTYSRLYGNYSGLTATDVSDSGYSTVGAYGRNGANADRAFDEPFMQFDANGKVINGPLPTDRPSTFKASGYYRLKWFGHETLLGAFQQIYSGTPLSSYISVHGAPVFVEGRGNVVDLTRANDGSWTKGSVHAARTPRYLQTDLNFVQNFHVSKKNESLVAGFEANVINLFNQHSPIVFYENMIRTGGINPYNCSYDSGGNPLPPCLSTNLSGFDYSQVLKGYDYVAQSNAAGATLNSQYNKPYNWQGGRSMRFKFKFTF